jgi:hypothetical protein
MISDWIRSGMVRMVTSTPTNVVEGIDAATTSVRW